MDCSITSIEFCKFDLSADLPHWVLKLILDYFDQATTHLTFEFNGLILWLAAFQPPAGCKIYSCPVRAVVKAGILDTGYD